MTEPHISPHLVTINDAAARMQVLAQQLRMTLLAITEKYPNNQLGGLLQRLLELNVFAQEHAQSLAQAADESMCELLGLANTDPIVPPTAVLRLFEQAEVIPEFLKVQEASQLAQCGKLVVLRDRKVQATHLVPKGAVVFDKDVDPLLVGLWWPRIFSKDLQVSLLPTEAERVWKETTMDTEDLPE